MTLTVSELRPYACLSLTLTIRERSGDNPAMRHVISAVVGCFVVYATTLGFPCEAISSSLVVDSAWDQVEVPFVCPNCNDQVDTAALAGDTRVLRLMDPRGTHCLPGRSLADCNLVDRGVCRSIVQPTATLRASLNNILRV